MLSICTLSHRSTGQIRMTTRAGQSSDIGAVYAMVRQLAAFERAPDAVELSEGQMLADFDNNAFQLAVAESDGKVIGFALYYSRYSTWTGSCLYLEDLYVDESSRGKGVGTALFRYVIAQAAAMDAARMEWVCLDWNSEAVAFYKKKFDAHVDSNWLQCKLVRKQFK